MTTHAENQSEPEIPFDLATLPEPAIHTLVIREWLKCFQQNADFKAYCDAKRDGDAATCAALELAHARIAELYEDWGDIHILPSMNESSDWWDWFEPRQHLFCLPDVEIIDPIERLAEPDGTTLVAIPNGLRKEQLLQVLMEFVASHPDILGDGPKYQIQRVKGESLGDTLKRIHRARTVYLMQIVQNVDPSTIKSFSSRAASSVVRSREANRYLGFGWFINGQVNQKLFEDGKLPSEELKNYTKTIDNLRKSYQACIDNTMLGIFPATKNF
ncbi:hypothetical protein EGY19_13815 [Burkholderia multivorans]|uniref:hypothetical protein n=1 Tax=Burkholderia multivorans TaxID=87883 RepID=UPI000CFFF07C|nr:hypothetical protein [Burkholderia multivorans]AYY98416.1 hypothetical protein EGY19_13815 [Burkholderia multivorans]MBU9120529.1 hypothetical protein [Burkholderia multivorans]PRG56259.1 hypothetical protein C6T63_05200 [Burkholderia multivorans]PRG79248.1 hypothetical protein C6T58_17855 [Burkholderia multivorans]